MSSTRHLCLSAWAQVFPCILWPQIESRLEDLDHGGNGLVEPEDCCSCWTYFCCHVTLEQKKRQHQRVNAYTGRNDPFIDEFGGLRRDEHNLYRWCRDGAVSKEQEKKHPEESPYKPCPPMYPGPEIPVKRVSKGRCKIMVPPVDSTEVRSRQLDSISEKSSCHESVPTANAQVSTICSARNVVDMQNHALKDDPCVIVKREWKREENKGDHILEDDPCVIIKREWIPAETEDDHVLQDDPTVIIKKQFVRVNHPESPTSASEKENPNTKIPGRGHGLAADSVVLVETKPEPHSLHDHAKVLVSSKPIKTQPTQMTGSRDEEEVGEHFIGAIGQALFALHDALTFDPHAQDAADTSCSHHQLDGALALPVEGRGENEGGVSVRSQNIVVEEMNDVPLD